MSLRPRATAALLLAALAASLLAAPVSAAGTVRWVDDDGHRGATGCDGTAKTTKTTIQAAIDASAEGDIVKVCPGVYKSEISIETLELRVVSVKRGAAVITHGPVMTAGFTTPLVGIGADGVTFSGFKVTMPVEPDCLAWDGIVVAKAKDVTVTNNTVAGRGDEASSVCGIANGIVFGSVSKGLAQGNRVKNWLAGGIVAMEGSTLRVLDNELQWTKVLPGPVTARTTGAARPAGAPSGPAIQFDQSGGRAVGNTIIRVKGASLPDHNGGIVLTGGRALVKNNTITRFDYGITVGYDSAGKLLGNTITKGANIGIYLYEYPTRTVPDPDTDPVVTVRNNTVHGFSQVGMAISSAPGNLIDHNDFSKNPGIDCTDDAPASSAWHWNKGADSDPTGLCRTPAKP